MVFSKGIGKGGWVVPLGPPGGFVIGVRRKGSAFPLASRLENAKKLRFSFSMDFCA